MAIRDAIQWKDGSSPHARGTRQSLHRQPRGCRFIPACAENARAVVPRPSCHPVHPRMRGERSSFLHARMSGFGSSPHARGTLRAQVRDLERGRFIPACAGNAMSRSSASGPRTVHPRMRGERTPTFFTSASTYGSSPHARGTPPAPRATAESPWFIPACAGNAFTGELVASASTVHPRMRGERRRYRLPRRVFGGSSPHARGTRRHAR